MDFVMVPVPEEHVVDVMNYVSRLVARAGVVAWDRDAVEGFFSEVDEACRSLLSLVARMTAAGKDLTEEDAAETLELNVREVRGIARDINDAAQKEKREPLVALREAAVVLRNGRTVQQRMFGMSDSVARMIRAHERSEITDERSEITDDRLIEDPAE